MSEENTPSQPEESPLDDVDCKIIMVDGVRFIYRSNERAFLAKYVGDDDHYGAEQLKGGSWVPVVYQECGWQADYVECVYGDFEQAVQAAWDYMS